MKSPLLKVFKCIMKALFKEQYQKSALEYSPGPHMSLFALLRLIWKGETHTTINSKQLKNRIDNNGAFTIVDIRSKKSFDEGHILNAVNIPLKQLVMTDDFPFSKDTELIVVCYLGVTSREAINILAAQGYRKVTHMVGGMGTWDYGKEQAHAT